MNPTAVVTIVSNNYLHFARTLMQSVARQHPEADRYCVIVDRDLSHIEALKEEFEPIQLDQLNLPDGDNFFFQYNVLELNTAVKPWALEYLVHCGYQNILYIDPDIALYHPLDDVFLALDTGSELVLTPHLLAPVTDTLNPGELDIRRAGTYNLGFCALRGGDNMLSMLKWWQGKLHRHCIISHDQGIFVDQSWMDLVPGLFSNVFVLRHPGYNVAYWNIAQRPIQIENENILVGGKTLAFFHYSGLNPLAPQPVSKYQNRFTLDNIGAPIAKLITDYCQQVINNGIDQYRAIPYGFGAYQDGKVITDADRNRFRINEDLRAYALGKPFSSQDTLSTNAPNNDGTADITLRRIYTHFLGRQPDESAVASFKTHSQGSLRRWRTVFAVGTSNEAKAKPGWLLRLLGWPLQHAQLGPAVCPTPATSPTASKATIKPSPYGGLHAPESDSAQHGLWVGPRLDLPVCAITTGHICIKGFVDLSLLARGRMQTSFHLDIHGPTGLLHCAQIKRSGAFVIEITVPTNIFATGSQWTILASSHIVPQAIGLSQDTRELAWRVTNISVDNTQLIDSSRSPTTQPIEELIPAGGINLIGYLAAELGLGEAARSLARACIAVDIPFSAVDVGYQSQNLQRDTTLVSQAVTERFPIDLIYVNADQTPATVAHLKKQGLQSRYRIGYWHWEQPQLPASALGAFAHVDEVWVPSTFVHNAVAPFSPVPVIKIPHALEIMLSPGLSRRQFGLPENKLLALVMYDFHSYQYRKNPQAALSAFRKAAGQRSDIALVIKTINGQHHTEARLALQASVSDLANIIFIDDFFTRQQTWDLQSCCDILISLHRAEGFGLVPAEMMYLGKPVIATDWSANTDFMTTENSMPVRYCLQTLSEPIGVYPAGQLWAEADVDHAAWCLTQLLDNQALRQQLGARAASDIQHQLNPQTIGKLVRQRLSLLGFWHPMLRQTQVGLLQKST